MDELQTQPAGKTADNPYAAGCAFIDGDYVPIAEARIPILDWGFLRSDVTYDVSHVWRGRFFRLDAHMDRFLRNAGRLRMTLPLDRAAIEAVQHACVARAGLLDAYVEVIATRGVPAPGSRDPRTCTNRFYALALPFVWLLPPERQATGIDLLISDVPRIRPESVDPTVKNFHWGDLMRGLFQAYDRGAESAVLVDGAGHVTEGPGFNLFVLKDGTLATPDRGVLEGITRACAIELAGRLNVKLEQRPVAEAELRAADEAFVTSTAGGIMPVASVDGRPLGDGRPGPVTQRLRTLYWDRHADPAWSTPVNYR